MFGHLPHEVRSGEPPTKKGTRPGEFPLPARRLRRYLKFFTESRFG